MQLVVAGSKASAGQLPEDPVQLSATSHAPAEGRQVVALDWNASTQVLAVPEQWSAASLSQGPPFDPPEQLVETGSNASVGQAPEDPVQDSATSQAPTDGRQVTVFALKTSTHEVSVPEQWSAASSSQAPPFDAPEQLVVEEA
jgi:hypothetical protein